MIEARTCVVHYPAGLPAAALRGVSFSLERGEKAALMGLNGSGKTTFVRCLNGLILPSSGEVRVDGMKTSDPNHTYEVRRRVGMVFQDPDHQIVAATVIREIAFGLENLGLAHAEMVARVEEALERFHLTRYREHAPHLLSGGERQRLAIASVWVMRPDYLILDEPTSLLDPAARRETLALLKDRTVRDMGILLVTQYPEEALCMERLIVMNRGRIVEDGSPDRIFRNVSRMKRLGVGVPAAYELAGFLQKAGIRRKGMPIEN